MYAPSIPSSIDRRSCSGCIGLSHGLCHRSQQWPVLRWRAPYAKSPRPLLWQSRVIPQGWPLQEPANWRQVRAPQAIAGKIVKQLYLKAAVAILVSNLFAGYASSGSLSDNDVRSRIIAESIASYPGHCPCPYNLASNGSQCGRRSAYSRAGGYSPLCYKTDVTDQMVGEYRRTHGLP